WDLLESSCFIDPETRQARAYQHDQNHDGRRARECDCVSSRNDGGSSGWERAPGEMKAEPAALPAPGGQSPEKLSSKRKPNRLMIEVDTAIGPQERIPRRMRAPADE